MRRAYPTEGGGQPRTLPAVPARPRTEARRRIMVSAADREEISRGIAEGVEGAVITNPARVAARKRLAAAQAASPTPNAPWPNCWPPTNPTR